MSLSEVLEQKLDKLSKVVEVEKAALAEAVYTEEELMNFYQDVLAVPGDQTQSPPNTEALRVTQERKDLAVIDAADNRMMAFAKAKEREVLDVAGEMDLQLLHEQTALDMELQPYKRVLKQAHEVMSRLEAIREKTIKVKDQQPVGEAEQSMEVRSTAASMVIPVAILSPKECEALVRIAVKEGDPDAAEQALSLIKRAGISLPESSVTEVLKLYADLGHPKEVEELLAKYLTQTPDDVQRHLHVKAHLNATPHDVALPNEALNILHHYESLNAPAPMKTYTLVISRLFNSHSSIALAHGWDLFTHMRYVAHPNPDVRLFTVMIRACASPLTRRYTSEPEKALDLWTEMTVDHNIMPNRAAYNAVILACARSGDKQYVNEAFRLSREMLNAHRDAAGVPAFKPDKITFCALLEGAKRLGELGRARWILAEMAKASDEGLMVDEEAMMHVFHAYASYDPPFKRGATMFVEEEPVKEAQIQSEDSAESSKSKTRDIAKEKPAPSLTHIPPQSAQEVITEAENLFNRIIKDRKSPSPSSKFSNVEITTRLINSYLSVFYKHSTLEKSKAAFSNVFEELGVERSARTYVEALERCGYSNSRRKGIDDRRFALKWGEELWDKWCEIERSGRDGNKKLYARYIERAYVAMIRTFTMVDDVERAVRHLRDFAHRYPPINVRNNVPKPLMRSSRTSLVGARPLVRMISDVEVPDDFVPPLITFRDLDVLHQRLIMYNRKKDIAYLTWLCKEYEWKLRVRRDATMKAKPENIERVPTAV
ncbi:hypothetical protein BDQ17DRAFT_1391436 [Cyathus striatus]|nr:hypothetical protein BDQ17DRAFT_1391436 [Cyathus striatus]